MCRQELLEKIEKLAPKEGDILVMRGLDRESAHAVAEVLSQLKIPRLVAVFLEDWQCIETMNEDQMRAAGWVRAPRDEAAGD
jgi:hypothetical protein